MDWGIGWAVVGWVLLAFFAGSGVGKWLKASREAMEDAHNVEDYAEYRASLAPRPLP